MSEHIKYVGLDVHAETIAIAVADASGGEARYVGQIPNEAEALRKALGKLGEFAQLRVCYEAGPCGYVVYWQAKKLGCDCSVVAPTLIPVRAGDRVKTDKRDAVKLARLHRSGELTAVWVPSLEHEALRNLVRARTVAKRDERRAKNRLGKFLLRLGIYRPQRTKAYGHVHLCWLRSLRDTFAQKSNAVTFDEYFAEYEHQHDRVLRLEQRIAEAIAALPESEQAVVTALSSLRGVAKTTAAVLFAEVGNFSRFSSPRQLMAYAGLVPSEYSSGQSQHRGALTKTGNAALRHSLVESAWSYRHSSRVGDVIKRRRILCSAQVNAISEKADRRLSRRYRHLVEQNKPTQKAATAIARELLGFVWAVAVAAETKAA